MIDPFLVFEITTRCNNNCIFCYNVWIENKNYLIGELSTSKIVELFDKIFSEIHPGGIAITGGEPLLYKNIVEIIQYLKKYVDNLFFITNGTMLTGNKIDNLIDKGITLFDIPLISLKKEKYIKLCGKDNLDKVKAALINIKKRKVRLNVSIIITRENIGEIDDLIDFAFSFSADSIALNRFVPRNKKHRRNKMLWIEDEEMEKALFKANEKCKKYKIPIYVTIPVENCLIEHSKFSYIQFGTCLCGTKKWAIDPFGNLRTCEQNPLILGNLLNSSFFELTSNYKAEAFKNNLLLKECFDCDKFANCGGGCRFLRTERTQKH